MTSSVVFVCVLLICSSVVVATTNNNNNNNNNNNDKVDEDAKCPLAAREREVLLELFEHTHGPSWRRLDNWANDLSPCGGQHGEGNWIGVICGACDERGERHVEVIGLEWNNLDGELPESIGELSHVQVLNLGTNSLSGALPSSLSSMPLLRALKVSYNQFSGMYPPSLYRLVYLELLELAYNDFVGNVNEILRAYPKMKRLILRGNRGLSGDFSLCHDAFQRMQKLRMFDAHWNNIGGTIPEELMKLPELEELTLSHNQLSGAVPNVDAPSLKKLVLSNNYLNGSLPNTMRMPNLTVLQLDSNYISGTIPNVFGSMRSLEVVQLSNNMLTGELPSSLFSLQHLHDLQVANNEFASVFPANVSNLRSLVTLNMHGCALRGSLPSDVGRLSALKHLDLSQNLITGVVPESVGDLRLLHELNVRHNHLSGSVPSSVGNLRKLTVLMLNDNHLEHVSERVGDCDSLTHLMLHNNKLHQPMPEVFGYLQNLVHLSLHRNKFTGLSVPSSYSLLSNLRQFTAHNNLLANNAHPHIDSSPPNPYNTYGSCGDRTHIDHPVSYFKVCGTRNDFYTDILLNDDQTEWLETHGDNWRTCYGKCNPSEHYEHQLDFQRTSRYRDMYEIADKAKFAHYMTSMHQRHGDFFHIHPRSFRMPFEYDEWNEAHQRDPNGHWLLKPTISCCGQNIRLIQGADDPSFPKDLGNWIIQRFVHPPHIIHGHKYVLRLFAVVTSMSPLRVYLHPDGDVFYSHSNYTLDPEKAKRSRGYFITDYFFTMKQRHFFTSSMHLFQYFREQGVDTDQMWRDVTSVVVKALMATEPHFRREEQRFDQQRSTVYEVLGYDIVIDENLRPWVCEVNTTPNLGLEINKAQDPVIHEEDFELKTRIMRDTLSLVGIVNHNDPPDESGRRQRHCERQVDERLASMKLRVNESLACALNDFECVTNDEIRMIKDFECEFTNQGEFVLVFPANDAHTYLPYFPVDRRENRLLAWWHRQRNITTPSSTPWSQSVRRPFRERSDDEWSNHEMSVNTYSLKWNMEEDGVLPEDEDRDRYVLDDGDHFSVEEFPEDREWSADEEINAGTVTEDGTATVDPRAFSDGPIDDAPEWLVQKP